MAQLVVQRVAQLEGEGRGRSWRADAARQVTTLPAATPCATPVQHPFPSAAHLRAQGLGPAPYNVPCHVAILPLALQTEGCSKSTAQCHASMHSVPPDCGTHTQTNSAPAGVCHNDPGCHQRGRRAPKTSKSASPPHLQDDTVADSVVAAPPCAPRHLQPRHMRGSRAVGWQALSCEKPPEQNPISECRRQRIDKLDTSPRCPLPAAARCAGVSRCRRRAAATAPQSTWSAPAC